MLVTGFGWVFSGIFGCFVGNCGLSCVLVDFCVFLGILRYFGCFWVYFRDFVLLGFGIIHVLCGF